jgi:hypothetical protein
MPAVMLRSAVGDSMTAVPPESTSLGTGRFSDRERRAGNEGVRRDQELL